VTQDLRRVRTELLDLQKGIKDKNAELEEKTALHEQVKGAIKEIDDLEGEKKRVNAQLILVKEDAASIRQKKISSEARIKEIEANIEEKERQLTNKQILEQIRIWMEAPFTLCLQDIEIHVLATLQGEFDQLFQRWFNTLIETADISVRIDPEFTPITEQGGYELEYGSLSGGERTAVALAYRFALNTIVKRVCEAMRSNLLILDEPTDGFSKEQLNKLRDVLNELNCEQVIMVSHERELEGFVDKVHHVTKEGGISRVQTANAK
jgi:exonuclease SbcC